MPTYGFRCPEGHEFDRFYKTMSAAPSSLECPDCGKTAERQLSGGAGLMFKGSGFYLTDYGKNAHRGGPKDSGGGDSAAAKPDAPKADSAKAESPKPKSESPAPKAESKPAKPKPKSE
jgi:putative FmdB family regulatory protein